MEEEFKTNKAYIIAHKTLEFAILLYLSCFAFGRSFREAGLTLMIISVFSLKIINKEWPKIDRVVALPLILFLMAFSIASIYSIDKKVSFEVLTTFIYGPVMLLFAVQEYIKGPEQIKRIQIALLFMVFIQGIDGIYQFFSGVDFIKGTPIYPDLRVTGSFSTHRLGNLLALAMPLVFLFSEDLKSVGKRLLVYLLVIAPLITIVLTKTRTAWVSLFVAYCVLIVFHKKRRFLYVSVLVASFIFLLFLPSHFQERAKSITSFTQKNPRMIIWADALEQFSTSMLVGHGPAALRYKETTPVGIMHPHNIYIQSLSEMGIIGFTSLIILFLSILYLGFSTLKKSLIYCDRQYEIISIALFVSLICFMVQGLSGHSLFRVWWTQFFFFLVGMMLSVNNLLKKDGEGDSASS